MAYAAWNDLDLDAGSGLAIQKKDQLAVFSGEKVIKMDDGVQFQPPTGGLQYRIGGLPGGDENLHARLHLAYLDIRRITRNGTGQIFQRAHPSAVFAVLLEARHIAGRSCHCQLVGTFLRELHIEDTAVLADVAITGKDCAAVRRGYHQLVGRPRSGRGSRLRSVSLGWLADALE